ncbi:MAG: DUF4430 domain-containing protein [Patescibacteria group bacterium]|nr:DUF4430 domain-containing protein [Patescibacteria group bacterium]
MKLRIILAALILSLFIGTPSDSYAATAVNVSDHCTVTDTLSVSHDYSGGYLAICALQQALTDGGLSDIQFVDFGIGLFIDSVNGIAPPTNSYWQLQLNAASASVGASALSVTSGDIISLVLMEYDPVTFSDIGPIGASIDFVVSLVVETPAASTNSGAGGLTLHNPFDVSRAISFLWSKQDASGSFGSSLLNDWVAIATAGGGAGDMRAHLAAYYFAYPPTLSSVTDYERHAMALEALGVNPYMGPTDYITPIVNAFDGTQVGEPSQDNDDIFALFPLLHAGYTAQDDIILKTTEFILSRQQADGSWDGSTDMTAAAVQALALVRSLPHVTDATARALSYLHAAQAGDGGFGDVSATSWVMQAATALGQTPFDWNKGTYRMPDYYIATQQELDGGIGPMSDDMQKRIWATAYAVPAIERKTWDLLLTSFPKPTSTPLVLGASTSTTATTTIATTSVAVAPGAVIPAKVQPTSVSVPAYTQQQPAAYAADIPVSTSTPRAARIVASAEEGAPFSWIRAAMAILLPWFF